LYSDYLAGLLSAYLSKGNSKGVLGETKGHIGPTTRARAVHEEPPQKLYSLSSLANEKSKSYPYSHKNLYKRATKQHLQPRAPAK
jgi:hypothetical protein